MYLPAHFRESRLEVLHALIEEHSFATLVSTSPEGLVASHVPLLLDRERGPWGTLIGHLARANGQWQSFRTDAEVLAIFQGPHGYVSPLWYESPRSVPTWNYLVVHAYGRPRVIHDPDELKRLVDALLRRYEGPDEYRRVRDQLPEEHVEKLIKGIVGFEIPISRIEGKAKLSQNRTAEERRRVVDALLRSGGEEGRKLAEAMRRLGVVGE